MSSSITPLLARNSHKSFFFSKYQLLPHSEQCASNILTNSFMSFRRKLFFGDIHKTTQANLTFTLTLKLAVRIQCGKKVTRLNYNKNKDTHSNAFISNFLNYDSRNRIHLLQHIWTLQTAVRLVFI